MAPPQRDSAPHGTCASCGWSGHDWAFRHQGECTKCYREGRRTRAGERRRLNVKKRLLRTAQAEVPHSVLHRAAERVPLVAGVLLAGGSIAFFAFDLDFGIGGRYLLLALPVGLLALLVLADRVTEGELSKRLVLVQAKLRGLVDERSRRIDQSEAFFASPEWRLLRDLVIDDQGPICRSCGIALASDIEITVGHVLPRREYPHLALSRDNLQVLCRSCNPRKQDRESS